MGETDSLQSTSRDPIVTVQQVRDFTGYTRELDAPTARITAAIQGAMAEVVGTLAPRRPNTLLTGVIDGENRRFMLRGPLKVILDDNLDSTSNAADVTVFLEALDPPSPPTYEVAVVEAVDGVHGIVTLQSAPVPGEVDRVRLTARLNSVILDKQDIQQAVLYLAAAMIDQAVKLPGATALSNPNTMQKDTHPGGGMEGYWLKGYSRVINRLRGVTPQAATRGLGFPRERSTPWTSRG